MDAGKKSIFNLDGDDAQAANTEHAAADADMDADADADADDSPAADTCAAASVAAPLADATNVS